MSTKKYRIGFYSSAPLEDRRNWSGSMNSMYAQLLKHGHTVEWIRTVEFSAFENKILYKIQKLYERIFNRRFNKHHSYLRALLAARKLGKHLRHTDIDILFTPTASNDIAFLRTHLPIIFVNDATTHQIINYNAAYTGLGWLSKKITCDIERRAFKKASALSFSSPWAAQDAIDFYKVPKTKVFTNYFGSNSYVPANIKEKDYTADINLLFLGVNWVMKGGEIALEATRILQKKGFPVTLQVVGCIPPESCAYMEVTPFLNKNIPSEAERIRELLENAHFLFVPTRSECYGIVFCEAASHGIPAISTATGGVSSIIINDETGITLPIRDGGAAYAEKIEELLRNPDKARQMGRNARKRFENVLNWDIWGSQMQQILEKILHDETKK